MAQPSKKQTRLRSVLLVISLLGLLLTSVFLNRRGTHEVQAASASIYADRLVPSGILVSLTSAIYRKRLLLETYGLAVEKPDINPISSGLDRLNRRVDSLLTKFGRTKLTTKEASQLQLLNERLLVYNRLEKELLASSATAVSARQGQFAGASHTAFGQVASVLDELSDLQLVVGEDLIGQSRDRTNSIYVVTALQMGLVILIGASLFWHQF